MELKIDNFEVDNKNIKDVSDGSIYQNLDNKIETFMTININTNGAPIFKSSKRSMWPIQFIVNEFSPVDRFHKVIRGGYWITSNKPTAK